jgi:hypothetical protein
MVWGQWRGAAAVADLLSLSLLRCCLCAQDVLDAELIRNLVTPGSPEEVKQVSRAHDKRYRTTSPRAVCRRDWCH